jgi:alcohol dehydrogenase class IV
MVKNFQFASTPKILFKPGYLAALPDIAGQFGKKIILVTGKKSFSESPYSGTLFKSLDEKGFTFKRIIIDGEPSPEIIDKTVAELNISQFDLVISIGGGSVLDAGKAISAMMYMKEPIISFLEGVGTLEHPGTKLPMIAVPTTAGTGSEATKNAVISSTGKNGFKRSLRHDNFVPDFAVIDPELTLACPPEITAASGMDCFTQLVESYLSTNSINYTDALAIEGLKAVKSSLSKSVSDGSDLEARTGMSFAALTSGICLANAGLGVVHGFASSIGGFLNIPHGIICGTLMPSANAVSVRKLREIDSKGVALSKYVTLGKLFLSEKGRPDHFYIDGFLSYLSDLADEIRLPRLGKYGLETKDIEDICAATENKYNPVKLGRDDMMEILYSRI